MEKKINVFCNELRSFFRNRLWTGGENDFPSSRTREWLKSKSVALRKVRWRACATAPPVVDALYPCYRMRARIHLLSNRLTSAHPANSHRSNDIKKDRLHVNVYAHHIGDVERDFRQLLSTFWLNLIPDIHPDNVRRSDPNCRLGQGVNRDQLPR